MKFLRFILALAMLINLAPTALASSTEGDMEIRGFWVATVYQINYPEKYTTNPDDLRAYADEILDDAVSLGFNTVFLQVRPTADSFYDSDVFPWSKYISGKQGIAPDDGFDPLEYWVEGAHKRGIELHAWINPYRVAVSKSDFNALADNHPAKINPNLVVAHTNGQYYFNPALPEARQLVSAGVREIVENYDVDGVHLDDYFYPDEDFADDAEYEMYGGNFDNIGDWRRNNVDLLIMELQEIVRNEGKRFGISPSGIWANKESDTPEGSDTRGYESYTTACADTRKWVKNEWIDYIVPQIYWNIGYSIADYDHLARWWADVVRGTNVDLYIGMADYRVVEDDSASVWYMDTELRRQLTLNRTIPEIKGEIHYSYGDVVAHECLKELYGQFYKGIEPEPPIEWLSHDTYIEGIGDEFQAEGNLTRAQAATLFARIMGMLGKDKFDEDGKYENVFTDVSDDAWYASYVGFMTECKIISGYPDGTYRPDATITRAEFATMISRLDELKTSKVTFPDVPRSHWAYNCIRNAYARGLISGYPDGTFCPEKTITRAETVKILNRLLGRMPDEKLIDQHEKFNKFSDLKKEHWAYYEIIEASFAHKYYVENDGEIWQNEDDKFIGENGFAYISDEVNFYLPKLRLLGDLTPLNLNKVDSIALHHMEHKTATFYDVERWHVEDNQWRAIGYNFWIDYDGTVFVGRGFNLGAGVGNHNSHVISVGFRGDYHESGQVMPEAQYEAGVALVKWICSQVATVTKIGGHNSWNTTDCPGSDFPLMEMVEESGLEYEINENWPQSADETTEKDSSVDENDGTVDSEDSDAADKQPEVDENEQTVEENNTEGTENSDDVQ